MTALWKNLSIAEQISSAQAVAKELNIDELAVEKDWWVTVVLYALTHISCGKHLLFKGGTSLSKGWKLINRFSEDIDLSLSRNFYLNSLGYSFAKAETNSQLMRLRKASRDYIHDVVSVELKKELEKIGLSDFTVTNITHRPTPNGPKPIDHDSDPTAIHVDFKSVFAKKDSDIEPRVKIEISCLSMDEPYEIKTMTTLIHDKFSDVDAALSSQIKTVTPTRTFLEKALLLNEEIQKIEPRTMRMSRHLYDLERIMDTSYGLEAIKDIELYKAIVEHRRKFYHLGYVNYDLDYPQHISFTPSGSTLTAFRRDYLENMVGGYIYGKAISFEELISRIEELQRRFRGIEMSK